MSERSLGRVFVVAAGLLIILAIGTPLIGVRAFHGADLLQDYAPWRPAKPHVQNPCVSDTVDAVMPARALLGRSVRAGSFPLWDPYVSGGTTLGATPDDAMLSPLELPYSIAPAWYAPALAKLLETIVAVVFTALFLGLLGIRRPAALFGGVLYAFSGFFVAWTNWPQAAVAALVPALFWSIERCLQRRSIGSAVVVAIVVASMALGGFPAVTGWALYAAAVYTAVRVVAMRRRAPSRAALVFAGVALGAALAAVQLLPFAAVASQRLEHRRQSSSAHLPGAVLSTAVAPLAFGRCGHGWFGPLNEIETQSFLGVTAIALAVFALGRKRRSEIPPGVRATFVAGAIACAALAYGGGTLLGFAQHLPVFHDNFVGRLRSLLGFFVAMLAAIGADAVLAGATSASRKWRTPTVAVLAMAFFGFVLSRGRVIASRAHQAAVFDGAVRRALIPFFLVIVVLLVAVRVRDVRWRRAAFVALPVVFAVEMLPLVWATWPRIPRSEFYPVTAEHQIVASKVGHDRFAAQDLTLFSATSPYYELRSVTGHAWTDPKYRDVLEALDPHAFKTATFSQLHLTPEQVCSPVLDRLAARLWVTGRGARAPGECARIVSSGAADVYERTTSLPRIRWASRVVVEPDPAARLRLLSSGVAADTAVLDDAGPEGGGNGALRVVEDGADRVRVRAEAAGAGYVVVADAMQHGWQATLDGRAVRLRNADHAFVAVWVPQGAHEVTLQYRPEGWLAGLAVSLATALALVAAWVWERRHARSGQAKELLVEVTP